MPSSTIQAHCPSSEFAKIEEQVRGWDDVEAVGSLREKECKKDLTTVFIKFKSDEAAQNAVALLKKIPHLSVDQKKKSKTAASAEGNVQGTNSQKPKKVNLAAEFFQYGSEDQRPRKARGPNAAYGEDSGNRGGRGGRGRGRAAKRGGPGGNQRHQVERHEGQEHLKAQPQAQNGSRGTGRRGGRGNQANQGRDRANYNNPNAAPRGSGPHRSHSNFHPYPFIPPANVSIAVVDNVPFNMTNIQLAEAFCPYGRILDISRLEMMAMVFYDSPESVQNCIQGMNGRSLKGNVISVSGGSMKIPGPIAVGMGAL